MNNACRYKCLSCSLKFSNARTLAMHQAGAHGGKFIILCTIMYSVCH